MRRNLSIELLEENGYVSIYSPKFENEDCTEFEKFLIQYKDSHPDDLAVIVKRIALIQENGIADRHFRYEGRKSDRVVALPSHLDSAKLRLYCLPLNTNILVLGNGGLKTTRTYNEDPILSQHVQILQRIDIEIKRRQKYEIITVDGCFLEGALEFYIEY